MPPHIKTCFVPACKNTSVNSKKIFITVPKQLDKRIWWYRAVGRDFSKSAHYCCEDHFVLKEDAENWMAYSFNVKRIQLRKGVVPHKNLLGTLDKHTSQLSDSAKKRKKLPYAISTSKSMLIDTECVECMDSNTLGKFETDPIENTHESNRYKLSQQTVNYVPSKFVITNIYKNVAIQTRLPYNRSVAVNTE